MRKTMWLVAFIALSLGFSYALAGEPLDEMVNAIECNRGIPARARCNLDGSHDID